MTPALSDRLYLLVARRDVACFRFFLEGQDNLALFSSLGQQERDGREMSALSLRFAPGARAQVLAWLHTLGPELSVTVLPAPPG